MIIKDFLVKKYPPSLIFQFYFQTRFAPLKCKREFENKIFKNYSSEFERAKIENQIFVKVDNFQETTFYLYS